MSDTLPEREDQTGRDKCSSKMPNEHGQETAILCALPDGHTGEHVNRSSRYRWSRQSLEINQHQVTKSGTCVIPGCPCRGWSAQECITYACPNCGKVDEHSDNCPSRPRTSEHQPVARGGGDAAGLVPATVLALAKKNQEIYDTDLSNALVKAVEVAHAEHQTLVAERRHFVRLVEAVKALRLRHRQRAKGLGSEDCGCDECLLLQPILSAIEHHEQRSTSA